MFKKKFSILLLLISLSLLAACSHEITDGSPDSPKVDTQAPVIKVYHSSVDITGVEQITISSNQLFIGSLLVASWTDNVTNNCLVSMKIDGNEVSSGQVPIVSGTLSLTVADDVGNSSMATINLKMQEVHPDITIYKAEVNIFGGAILGIHNSYLSINDEEVMAWNDKYTENCTVTVTQNGKTLSDGDLLSEAGTLTVSVTNRQGKSSVAEITLICKAITGIEALSLQVDTETDLLNGVTLANDATVVKVEIVQDGNSTVIADPSHFTPEYPGTCTLIFTVQGRDGSTTEEQIENVTIKPLNYTAPSIPTASMIATTYPWYNNLQQSTRNFIYPHLLASYAACNHSKLENRVHVIMGESYDHESPDNISSFSETSKHAYQGYWRIKSLCPGVTIKCCLSYSIFEEYYNENTNNSYFASCASDLVSVDHIEQLYGSNAQALRRLLNNKNYFLSAAIGNVLSSYYKTYNENIKDGNFYCSASINSLYYNKITVTGYNTWGRNNFFAQSNDSQGLSSRMPVGFDITKGNIVMPMSGVIGSGNDEDKRSTSSFPTAVTSAVVGNAVAVVMGNRAGLTPVDAMEIIVNNYLREETFQYMDETTNWELTDGGKWYFLKMDELLNNELLQASKLESLALQGDDVALPQGKGICYMGKGVQFEVDGVRHNLSDTSALTAALKAGDARWYWNRRLFRKQGGTTNTELDVYITDLNGEKIPDLHLTITKTIH